MISGVQSTDFSRAFVEREKNPTEVGTLNTVNLVRGVRPDYDAAQKEFDTALKMDNTLNPDLQDRINQIVKGRKSKP